MVRNKDAGVVSMTPNEFKALAEYSCTLPTGVFVGKAWKRREQRLKAEYYGPLGELEDVWYMGTYTEIEDKTKCGIEWYRIVIIYPITDYTITGNYPAYDF